MSDNATVVYVAYGVDSLDLSWIPAETSVVIVHNDALLTASACQHRNVSHFWCDKNLGFGPAVNRALAAVTTPRVILCNPDTVLTDSHFEVLNSTDPSAIMAIPLVEADGVANAVVTPYWNVPAFIATAWRLGRFVPRGGPLIDRLLPLLGPFGAGHKEALAHTAGEWPLSERWVSGAVFSIATAAIRSVGGFDDAYFLYFEDADLHQRLGQTHPELRIHLADVDPGRHTVGGSVATSQDSADVRRHRQRSARTYASRQPGPAWRIAETLIPRGVR